VSEQSVDAAPQTSRLAPSHLPACPFLQVHAAHLSFPAFSVFLPPPCCARACSGHQSFSNNKALNDLIGNIVHSSIMVPYHGWRISHRTHHANVSHATGSQPAS
jgi:hypothetical protein